MVRKQTLFVLILFCVGMVAAQVPHVAAAINSCSATVQPHSVAPYSSQALQFTLNNTDTADIQWVTITSPSDNFVIDTANAPGWNQESNNISAAVFQDGSLTAGSSQLFQVNIVTPNQQSSAENWTVEVSDDPGGANSYSCSGTLSTTLVGNLADSTPPTIYNIDVVPVSATSVSVTWQTDEPSTSIVDYGLDTIYGDQVSNGSALTTSHLVTLTGLKHRSSYHYQITSTDAAYNTSPSGDNTFITSDPPVSLAAPTVAPVAAVVTPATVTEIPLLKKSAEKNPPTVKVTYSGPKVVATMPTVAGSADDDTLLASVQYSTDSGKNWLPVDSVTGLGSGHATFSFTPKVSDDGNYGLLVRAIDTSSNVGLSAPFTIVIDRLPPELSGSLLSLGPQVLEPGSDGTFTTVAGIDQKLTISSVGGPTSVSISAQLARSKRSAQVFTLTYSEDTGLWSGTLNFSASGQYNLTIHGQDGAGNTTNRNLSIVRVLAPARVVTSDHKSVTATVTAYYQLPDTKNWVVWDGTGYSQHNPQLTPRSGTVGLFLPAGTYYLKVKAPGYHTLVSSTFTLHESTPLTTELKLSVAHGLRIGSANFVWPTFGIQQIASTSVSTQAGRRNSLVGRPLPALTLTDTDGKILHAGEFKGVPTDLVAGTTWAPTMSEQLPAVSALQARQTYRVLPIALQENAGKARAYAAIAGLKLRWLVDPNSSLSSSYGVPSVPTHYFVDRSGIVRSVVVGVLTEQQMQDMLGSL